MGLADIHGKARVDPRNPKGFAECDECGEWYNRDQLDKQMEFSGTRTFWTGFLVCPSCLSEPQPQFLNPILPGDPKPIIQPRPARPTSSFIAPRFSLFELPLQPRDGATVLTNVAALSGVATPSPLADESVTITTAMQAQQILDVNAQRSWLVIYNPNDSPIVVSTGNAAFSGDPNAILLGGGQALFALSPVPVGAVTAIAYFAGLSLMIFEATPPAGTTPPIPVIFP